MDKLSLISVIVPVFNVEQYIDKAIKSLVEQTYKNIEIILIVQPSNDKTLDKCSEWIKKDNRIQIYNIDEKGSGFARNYGIGKARGRYIFFMDSDDYIDLNIIEILYSKIIDSNADISMCTHRLVGLKTYTPQCDGKTYKYSAKEMLNIYSRFDEKYSASVWQRLYKKNLVEDIHFPIGIKCEDLLWSARVFYAANNIIYIDLPMYNYNIREGSLMRYELRKNRKIEESEITDQLGEFIKLERFYQKLGMFDDVKRIKMAYLPIVFNSYCSIRFYKSIDLEKYVPYLEELWKKNIGWIRKNISGISYKIVLAGISMDLYELIWRVRQALENKKDKILY